MLCKVPVDFWAGSLHRCSTGARARSTLAHGHSNAPTPAGAHPLSTVLAQDHFYSDFLSLHVTLKTPISTRRMRCNCLPTRRVPQGLPCRVDDSLGMQSADWCTHKFDAALGACGEGVCTGQQPSCQVTVCGIKRGAVRIVPAWHAGSFML